MAKIEGVCKCCGRQLPDAYDEIRALFNPHRWRLFAAVKDAGVDGIGITALLKAVTCASPKSMHVTISQMNSTLKPYGLALRGHRGPGSVYRLEKQLNG